jgi:FlaA1/EpsC-like NDP-sugar epimerase
MGSRGSVIPFFMAKKKSGVLPITDPAMTRFNITLEEGVKMVLQALDNALGGELFVPKIPSYRITDVATAIGPDCQQPIVGIRPGEKLHEQMITASDAVTTVDLGDCYAILPQGKEELRAMYLARPGVTPVAQDFNYDSGTNTEWLSVDEIRRLIREHVDADFDLS